MSALWEELYLLLTSRNRSERENFESSSSGLSRVLELSSMEMKKKDLVFITTTVDEEKIYAFRKDVEEICNRCDAFGACQGADIEDGCGCVTAFIEICYREKQLFYESDLKKEKS